MKYNTMIVGLGNIGLEYDLLNNSDHTIKTHARAFYLHKQFELKAGVDLNQESCEKFKKHYYCQTFTDLTTALIEVKPDIVVIATPTHRHLENIQTIIKNSNPKAILCEKPLSYHIEDATQINELCKKNDIKLFVNYICRADPAVIEIKKRFETGEIASPVRGIVWYSKGFLHNGSHFFDLLSFWLGSMKSSHVIKVNRDLTDSDCEPDVYVEFTGGDIIFIAAQEEFYSHYTVELISPNGRLRYEQARRSIVWQSVIDDPLLPGSGYRTLDIQCKQITSDLNRYQYNVAQQMAAVLCENTHSLCTGQQALETLKSMHSIINNTSTLNI